MLSFNKPIKLNGATLLQELKTVGLKIESLTDNAEGLIYLDLNNADKVKAQKVIDDHVGEDTINLKTAAKESALAKLAALGLTAEEIATL